MRAAVSARLVPCRPVRVCSHLLLSNIVILNEINGDGEKTVKAEDNGRCGGWQGD